jgi:predicted ArsR family transcriptional regulator
MGRCPLVLALLARGPRRAHEVARAFDNDHPAARVALARLEAAGLVRRRALARGPDYLLTARGYRELRLQRLLWARIATGAAGGHQHH